MLVLGALGFGISLPLSERCRPAAGRIKGPATVSRRQAVHTGVLVYGSEYWYGIGLNDREDSTSKVDVNADIYIYIYYIIYMRTGVVTGVFCL